MLLADQLPTLWAPEDLFAHLTLWAGIPAIGAAIVVYSCAKSWLEFVTSTARAAGTVPAKVRVVRGNVRDRMPAQQRAMVRLVFSSVFTVVFSYMLAEVSIHGVLSDTPMAPGV